MASTRPNFRASTAVWPKDYVFSDLDSDESDDESKSISGADQPIKPTTTLSLLDEVREILHKKDTELKSAVTELHLLPGCSKPSRQLILIENLLHNSIQKVIQDAVNNALTNLVMSLKDTIRTEVKREITCQSPKPNASPKPPPPMSKPIASRSENPLPERMSNASSNTSPLSAPAMSYASIIKQEGSDGSKWSMVKSKRASRIIVGKTLSTTIQGKAGAFAQRNERKTASLYVGNLEPTVASKVHDYIKDSFKKSFGKDLQYLQVYPLVKKQATQKDDVVESSSFRINTDQQDTEDLFNPLLWPNYVIARPWKFTNNT